MDIVPAILVKTPDDLTSQIVKLSEYFSHFQIDITDGEFVSDKTIDIDEIAKALEKVKPETLKNLTFDFDLMVVDYMDALEKIDELSYLIKTLTVLPHASAITNYKEIAELYAQYTVGIAVDPDDSIDTINQNFDLSVIPTIQIMSVVPGRQGNPFLEDSLIKIEQLRMVDYRGKIFIDGGVNDKTLPVILSKKERPDVVCIGSYLSRANELKARIKKARALVSIA